MECMARDRTPEMGDTIRVQDRFLGDLVNYLNNRLKNQWVLCLTADHGHTASPDRTGGTPVLLQDSVSVCVPTGTPTIATVVQTRVIGS